MYTKIELDFYKTFNIEPDNSKNAYFTGRLNEYPKITSKKLLKLIELKTNIYGVFPQIYPHQIKTISLKEFILNAIMLCFKHISEDKKEYFYNEVKKIIS